MSGFTFGSGAPPPAPAPSTFGATGVSSVGSSVGLNSSISSSNPSTVPSMTVAGGGGGGGEASQGASKDDIYNAYKSKSLEEIINSYSTSLTADTSSFLTQAKRVSEWDGILRTSSTSISSLTSQVSRLMLQQDEVDKVLNSVSSYQSELSSQLSTLESLIDSAFSATRSQEPTDADVQRERSYQRVIDVDHRLRSILQALSATVRDLNESEEADVSKEGSVGQIVKILNAHHETLGWLEGKARGVERELNDLNRK
ncbi:hypothetical protein TrST_g836 [Triparma strigata]|uniref:Nucleoporin NSP1-like C-terminal domain-containing protein n=1 Tax=Triparma strigata TaxID=1606541 RepID=A0A9W7BX19_9STRA|nr:hypothetical protein TrST_g836 [Triparma strigata]